LAVKMHRDLGHIESGAEERSAVWPRSEGTDACPSRFSRACERRDAHASWQATLSEMQAVATGGAHAARLLRRQMSCVKCLADACGVGGPDLLVDAQSLL
jgi:hypothetical protein